LINGSIKLATNVGAAIVVGIAIVGTKIEAYKDDWLDEKGEKIERGGKEESGAGREGGIG